MKSKHRIVCVCANHTVNLSLHMITVDGKIPSEQAQQTLELYPPPPFSHLKIQFAALHFFKLSTHNVQVINSLSVGRVESGNEAARVNEAADMIWHRDRKRTNKREWEWATG